MHSVLSCSVLSSPQGLVKHLIMNTFLGYLILAPLICCCFICLCGFQIEIVEEARTFCILQLHKESTGYSRQEKSMTVIWSTSHCNSSWTTFTYINCWLKHNRLIQAKCQVHSLFLIPMFVLLLSNLWAS